MDTFKLLLGAIATCTVGLIVGFAAQPVMKQADQPDWRGRYHAASSDSAATTAAGQGAYFNPTYSAGPALYEPGAGRTARYVPEADSPASYQMQSRYGDVVLEPDEAPGAAERRTAQAAVADALAQTATIGGEVDSEPAVAPEAVAAPVGADDPAV